MNEPYVVATLSEKELNAIINDSFTEEKDEEVKSTLTSNEAKFSINRMNVKILDDNRLKYVFDVSANGYVCHINQDTEFMNDIYDFETYFYAAQEIESGGVKFTGSTNEHVNQILSIENSTFNRIKSKQPKAFDSNSLSSRFDINLIGISGELTNPKLQFAPKETSLDSLNKTINFFITRIL